MGRSKTPNVVAFPLSRSERLTPRQGLLKFENGRIVAVKAESAETVDLREVRARMGARSSTRSGLLPRGAAS